MGALGHTAVSRAETTGRFPSYPSLFGETERGVMRISDAATEGYTKLVEWWLFLLRGGS